MAETLVIDISSHNGNVDFAKAKAFGVRGVAFKATEGVDFVDYSFGDKSDGRSERLRNLRIRYEAIRKAGLAAIPYHFARQENRPAASGGAAEAVSFCNVLDAIGYPQGCPVVLDHETGKSTREWHREFAAVCHNRGFRPMVYGGRFHLLHRPADNMKVLWLAAYVSRSTFLVYRATMRTLGWQTKMWQYTDRLAVSGCARPVDANWWFGDAASLAGWAAPQRPKPAVQPKPKPGGAKVKKPWKPDVKAAQQRLVKIGWPIKVDGVYGARTAAAVAAFQEGWAGRVKLPTNGRLGMLGLYTARAIKWSADHDGKCGQWYGGHFAYREFKSKGDGWIKVQRALVIGLEEYRKKAGPVTVVSGYRDPAHNRKVGGAQGSQHLYGSACDLRGELTPAQVKSLGVFSGIGYSSSSGRVLHVDVRHASGHNSTGATVNNPTVWKYS